jgi:hypothetical protein
MLSATTQRVELNSAPLVNQKFEAQLRDNISRFAAADRQAIEQRLRELDSEWNIERFIETEAPTVIGLGIALGAALDRRWFALSVLAASMVIVHSVQGWYPLLPLLRRLGLRSQNEIEQERSALRVLLGEHQTYRAPSAH